MRTDGRAVNELRKISFQPGIVKNATGSVLAVCGNTEVICTATFTPGVPGWMKAQGVEGGWLTAEYAMLPASTGDRNRRENKSGPGGRSSEIQRLIGRSLRSIVDLKKLGEFTVNLDCDVLNADGGTRCTSINGAVAALQLAVQKLMSSGDLTENPVVKNAGAVSVGIVDGVPMLDLCYVEDSAAEVDMNVVMTSEEEFIEVQGTAEGMVFKKNELDQMLELASGGIKEIIKIRTQLLDK